MIDTFETPFTKRNRNVLVAAGVVASVSVVAALTMGPQDLAVAAVIAWGILLSLLSLGLQPRSRRPGVTPLAVVFLGGLLMIAGISVDLFWPNSLIRSRWITIVATLLMLAAAYLEARRRRAPKT